MAKKKPIKNLKIEKSSASKKSFGERLKDEKILYAWLATFLSIVGFVIAIIAKRDDEYVMYYAKHSLVIFIMGAVAGAISYLLGWIMIIGWIIKFALFIIIFIIWLLSWLYALEAEEKAIPIVTSWANKFNL